MENLGPWSGVYRPGYQLLAYRNGDPSQPIRGVDWRSATRVATSKLLTDTVGTFDISMKDARARENVRAMDVIVIRLRGHNHGWGTVLRCVVDEAGPSDQATTSSAQQDTVITGRCTGKYLQINSMFLPVWDPQANLPTALTFGTGDASQKLGTNENASTPKAIFGYIYDKFVVGERNAVGLSGTPNARFWLNKDRRFETITATNGKPFSVPFVQFDEDTCDTALDRLEIQGFSEAWVDAIGQVVYRRPAWDAPVQWSLHTSGLMADSLQDSDIGLAGYTEVFPGAFPGVSSGVAQAMLAGRAPIPSDYVTGLQKAGFKSIANPEFIVDVDPKTGKPTAKGLKNYYYQLQRKYGLRPYQITSPLLASREQAQAQAEGLLRQMLRLNKSGTITIPGEPNVGIGQTLHLWGSLRGQKISRVYYIEGISHEYIEGSHYTTTLTLTHGRDPSDPHWIDVALPQFSPSQLAEAGGILAPSSGGTGHNTGLTTSGPGGPVPPPNQRGVINPMPGWSISNPDYGIDADAPEGHPLYAPADCHIIYFNPNFYAYGLVLCEFDVNLPGAASQFWYYSEYLAFTSTNVGHSFKQGAVVATRHNGAFEIGWGYDVRKYGTSQNGILAQLRGLPDHSGAGGSDWSQNVYGKSFADYFSIPHP